MITVNIIAKGAELFLEQPAIACGTVGKVKARFLPDGLWQGLSLSAVFRTREGDILMPLYKNECDIPYEAVAYDGEVGVGLFGSDGERTVTSVFCTLSILSGTPTDGREAVNYTPSLYEQFSARFSRFESFSVSAEKGESASVERTDGEGGINLHFTIPKGDSGKDGRDGADGYTPVRGVDYWTDADKADVKSYVDQAILGGAW